MEFAADDYALAFQLQEQLDKENRIDLDGLQKYEFCATSGLEIKDLSHSESNERTSAVTDNCWELIDPNPDARQLFIEFNQKYFWNKLCGVEVRWSSRMTL